MDKLKMAGKCIAVILILNAAFMLFMTLTYMIPVDGRIKTNIGDSLYALENEDPFPIFHDPAGYWIDLVTDMIWMNIAAVRQDDPFRGAVELQWKQTKEEIPEGGTAGYYHLIQALYYPDADSTGHADYSRCVALFVGVLKLLFLLFDITEIRYILYFGIFILDILLLIKVDRMLGWRGLVPLTAAIAIRMWELDAVCFSTVTDIFIALLMMLAVVHMTRKGTFRENHIYIFLVAGAFAYATGMFIAPLLTLGMPLVLSIMLNDESDRDLRAWLRVLADSLIWVAGYIVSLLIKQAIARAVLGRQSGTESMLYWFAPEMGIRERLDRIVYCLGGLFSPSGVKIPFMVVLVIILLILMKRNGFVKMKNGLLLVFAGLYPFVWIFFLARHSQHYWAANILSISVFAFLSVLTLHIKNDNSVVDGIE